MSRSSTISNTIGPGDVRNLFTDVIEEGSLVRAVAEIPGVAKEDVSLTRTRIVLSIRVNSPAETLKRTCAALRG